MTLDDALQIATDFYEHTFFEDDVARRNTQNERFILGQDELPIYEYPKLNELAEQNTLIEEKKNQLSKAIAVIEQAQTQKEITAEKAQLFIDCNKKQLLRIELVESAAAMLTDKNEKTREQFTQTNKALFGVVDTDAWLGCMSAVRKDLTGCKPANQSATDIKRYLEPFFERLPQAPQKVLIDDELLGTFQQFLTQRYKAVLAAVPNSDNSVYYDAEQCAEIMRRALKAGELENWKVIVDASKFATSTNALNRTISIPANLRRNASELKRLIIHEQECHARRGENGSKYSDFSLLQQGTANYSAAEEGLGVFLEMMLAGNENNPSLLRAKDRYITAGLAVGADGTPRNARDTFELLWRIIAVRYCKNGSLSKEDEAIAKQVAVGHIENAFRGTDGSVPGVIYGKLQVYYDGLLKNIAYTHEIAIDPETFEQKYNEMFIGKYNHTDPEERALVLASI